MPRFWTDQTIKAASSPYGGRVDGSGEASFCPARDYPAITTGCYALERQMHRQLQEARTAQRVLDNSQAAHRRKRGRARKVGEECNVVVGRVEIRMVEEVKRVGIEAQLEPFTDLK